MTRLGLRWSACFRTSSSRPRHDSQVVTEIPPYLSPSKEINVPFKQSAIPSLNHPPSLSMPVITVTDSGANDLFRQYFSETMQSSTLDSPYVDRDRRGTQRISLRDPFPLSPRSAPETRFSEHNTSNMGMSSQRSPDRLSSLSPSSGLGVETPNTSECSLSLDEFPRPPTQPSLPSPVLLSPTGSGKLSFSFPTSHCNGAYGFEMPNQGGLYVLPSVTNARPPSYCDNLRCYSLAQASSITLPSYPGRADGDYTSSCSIFASRHDSVKTLRGDHCDATVPSLSSLPLAKMPF